jgi:hypothetical protein
MDRRSVTNSLSGLEGTPAIRTRPDVVSRQFQTIAELILMTGSVPGILY